MAKKIIVYGHDSCGFCKAAVEFLKMKGVKFEYRDILAHSDEVYKEFCEKKGICEIAVPLIKIGDKVIVGFNKKALEREI